jgi:hypothetical protein
MSYYELKEPIQFLLGQCQSFETYLRRNRKYNKSLIDSALLFVSIIKKLLKGKDSQQKLFAALQSATSIIGKNWLLEKAAAYKAKHAAR